MLQSTAGLALWSAPNPGEFLELAAQDTPALRIASPQALGQALGRKQALHRGSVHSPVLAAASEAHACGTCRAGDSETACSLFWESDKLLYIGWSCMVQVGQSAPPACLLQTQLPQWPLTVQHRQQHLREFCWLVEPARLRQALRSA